MALIVYILCTLGSSLCAALLLTSHRRNGTPLLFWSGLCFTCIALNNVLLIVDALTGTWIDLSAVRNFFGASGVCLLLYGMLWKREAGVEVR
jgi:hypothetical protein